jgi:hypothetical protein
LIDVESNKVSLIPVPSDKQSLRVVRWRRDGIVELTTGRYGSETTDIAKRTGDDWQFEPVRPQGTDRKSTIDVELRQNLNTPPALFGKDTSSGKEQLLLDLNPALRDGEISLGRVELVHWKSLDGSAWSGLLLYPTDFVDGKTYPFVVQTHGYSATEFLPDGSPISTAFAAQELANHGIAVLQLGGPDSDDRGVTGTAMEVELYASGFEGAIRHFVSAGLASADKVGLVGFSRTVWITDYVLTHLHVQIAAANVSDGIEGGYFEYVLGEDAARGQDNGLYGAAPFGRGLDAWAKSAPGFNVDKVQAPVRIEFCWGPIQRVVAKWEFFSHLRYLHKPVEMYIIPDIAHGVHQLQNPKQRLASLGGTVDWFRFWLKGEEDPDPAKTEQYARWRQLKELQNEAKKAP